jgi:hypothetical protein
MSEANLWQELKTTMEFCPHPGWHASRVESHALSAGIPDVDYCYLGDGHIELKYGHVHMMMPEIRDTQIRWMLSRSSVGGKVYILTKLQQHTDPRSFEYLWHRGAMAMELYKDRSYDFWFNSRMNDNYWELNLDEILTILKGERG